MLNTLIELKETKTNKLNKINKSINDLGYVNFGYGAAAFVGEGYYFISPIGEGMPSRLGAKYTDSGKWIGANVPKEVKSLIMQYKAVINDSE